MECVGLKGFRVLPSRCFFMAQLILLTTAVKPITAFFTELSLRPKIDAIDTHAESLKTYHYPPLLPSS